MMSDRRASSSKDGPDGWRERWSGFGRTRRIDIHRLTGLEAEDDAPPLLREPAESRVPGSRQRLARLPASFSSPSVVSPMSIPDGPVRTLLASTQYAPKT